MDSINIFLGDSGNALINYAINGTRTVAVQMGIVVAGNSRCGQSTTNFPGIYSSVPHYLEWILRNIEE